MPTQEQSSLAQRVARLAEFLSATDAVRIRIERPDEEIELARSVRGSDALASPRVSVDEPPVERQLLSLDAIKADLVGIVRFSRPAPFEGELLEQDRELAYIEALGIRNPVHSLGGGRIASIAIGDGAPVEYGQPLFFLDRG